MKEVFMRIIIAGSRNFSDYLYLKKECEDCFEILKQGYNSKIFENIEIVSGGANGADKLGERFAKDNNYKLKIFLADWNTHGKSAGYKRNLQMAEYAINDFSVLIAFWDGISKGTKHMIDIANRMKFCHIFTIKYKG